VSSPHDDIGPELRQLAQAILDRLDPAVRAVAAMAADSLRGPGRCEQVWCPVCALAALVNGEQHPLLTVVAEHSVTLLGIVRAMAADPPPSAESEPAGDEPPSSQSIRFHHIPIVVEPVDAQTVGETGSDTVEPKNAGL
jgi:hypothetical protein